MVGVIEGIDEVTAMPCGVEALKDGDPDQSEQVQGIKATKAVHGKAAHADGSGRHALGEQPEEHEPRDGEKQLHRQPPVLIERRKQAEERLARNLEGCRTVTHVEKVLPVPEHDTERGETAQGVQGIEPFGRRGCSGHVRGH